MRTAEIGSSTIKAVKKELTWIMLEWERKIYSEPTTQHVIQKKGDITVLNIFYRMLSLSPILCILALGVQHQKTDSISWFKIQGLTRELKETETVLLKKPATLASPVQCEARLKTV